MHRITLPIVCLAGAANAGVHIEVAAAHEGPDGLDTFGAVIGQSDPLGVWIWSDEPGMTVHAIAFDLVGAVFGSPFPDDNEYRFDSLGQADPDGLFLLTSSPGTLVGGSLIQGVEMATFPLGAPPIVLPTDPADALLIYTGFTGTPWAFTGGATPSDVFVFSDSGAVDDIRVHGWYQIPAPAATPLLATACVLARRRRA